MGEEIYKVEKEKNTTVVTLTLDNITMYENEQMKKAFSTQLEQGSKNIVLDLSNTAFISSLVIASMVSMLKRVKEAGGNLVLCGVKDKVKEVLSITGLDQVFDITSDRKTAVERLGKK